MKKTASGLSTALACALLAGTSPVRAADVTYERLLNPEPQNWLMHHRDYWARSAIRRSRCINKANVKNHEAHVRGAARRQIGRREHRGDAAGRRRLHVHGRQLGRRLQDRRALRHGRQDRLEDGPQDRASRTAIAASRCGAISSSRSPATTGRVIATDKETGKIVWDKNLLDQADLELTAAPLALKDTIIIGGSGGDRGLRNWVAALDPKTGEMQVEDLFDPGARRARQRDLEGQEQRLADRRRRLLRHRLLRSRHQSDLLGLGQSGAGLRFVLSSRRQSLHQQRDRLRCRRTARSCGGISTRRTTTGTTTRSAATS